MNFSLIFCLKVYFLPIILKPHNALKNGLYLGIKLVFYYRNYAKLNRFSYHIFPFQFGSLIHSKFICSSTYFILTWISPDSTPPRRNQTSCTTSPSIHRIEYSSETQSSLPGTTFLSVVSPVDILRILLSRLADCIGWRLIDARPILSSRLNKSLSNTSWTRTILMRCGNGNREQSIDWAFSESLTRFKSPVGSAPILKVSSSFHTGFRLLLITLVFAFCIDQKQRFVNRMKQ